MGTRLFPRYKFEADDSCPTLLVDHSSQQELPVVTRDLSPTGVAFHSPITSSELKPGDVLTLCITPFATTTIQCSARIVRTQATDSGVLYAAQFVGLPLLIQERIHGLIREANFAQRLKAYSEARDLRIRLTSKAMLQVTLLLGLLITAIFTVNQYFNL